MQQQSWAMNLLPLRYSYPASIHHMNLWYNTVVLTQVKDIPTVKWPAEKGALYTVVMAGKYVLAYRDIF